MAMNFQPVFALTPKLEPFTITAATTDKSGDTTTNIIQLTAAPADGIKVTRIRFKFTGTSTAGIFLVWITDNTGANPRLQYEQTFGAVTSSTTTITTEGEILLNDLQLESGQEIWVAATTVNTTIHGVVQYGELGDNV
jgi:hypothetical protein